MNETLEQARERYQQHLQEAKVGGVPHKGQDPRDEVRFYGTPSSGMRVVPVATRRTTPAGTRRSLPPEALPRAVKKDADAYVDGIEEGIPGLGDEESTEQGPRDERNSYNNLKRAVETGAVYERNPGKGNWYHRDYKGTSIGPWSSAEEAHDRLQRYNEGGDPMYAKKVQDAEGMDSPTNTGGGTGGDPSVGPSLDNNAQVDQLEQQEMDRNGKLGPEKYIRTKEGDNRGPGSWGNAAAPPNHRMEGEGPGEEFEEAEEEMDTPPKKPTAKIALPGRDYVSESTTPTMEAACNKFMEGLKEAAEAKPVKDKINGGTDVRMRYGPQGPSTTDGEDTGKPEPKSVEDVVKNAESDKGKKPMTTKQMQAASKKFVESMEGAGASTSKTFSEAKGSFAEGMSKLCEKR